MPSITIYVNTEQYKKLLDAGNNPSKVIQKALKQYWGGK